MNIMVIGGAGFIGRNLLKELKENNDYNLFSFDLIESIEGIESIIGDILDQKLLINSLKNIDVVFIKAGILGNPEESMNINSFDKYFNINLVGLNNILEACILNNIKKIIYDSSISIYGEQEDAFFAKEDVFPKPRNLYGYSKVNAERLLTMICTKYKINLIILRYSRVRTISSKDVIYHFFNSIKNDQTVTIKGNPLKKIEFVDLQDVIKANLLSLEKSISYGQFNISSGDVISIKELLELLMFILNKNSIYNYLPEKNIIEPTYTHLDMKNAKEILGYNPSISLNEMIEKVIKHEKDLNDKPF